MAITLTYLGTTLTLPPDLSWPDEFAWRAVTQRRQYTITGDQIVEEAARQAGRPITLAGAADRAHLTRALLLQLQGWHDTPGITMTLSLRGTSYTVAWASDGAPALSASPVFDWSDPESGDRYVATLRLIET